MIMKLKHTKYTAIQVDCFDLEQFIRENLPQFGDYEIVAENEWHNNCYHEIIAKRLSDIDRDDEVVMIQDILNGKTGNDDWDKFPTWGMLNALCEKGSIEEGTYLIDVCW